MIAWPTVILREYIEYQAFKTRLELKFLIVDYNSQLPEPDYRMFTLPKADFENLNPLQDSVREDRIPEKLKPLAGSILETHDILVETERLLED